MGRRCVRHPLRGEQLAFVIEVPTYPIANPATGEPITTASGNAIVTSTEWAGREQIIWADYGSGIAQPHISDSLFSPEQMPQSLPPPPRPRRHSAKGAASGWIEERIGNRKRPTPSTSYYYRWQDETGRHTRYIPAGKLWRVQQLVEVEGKPIAAVLEVLNGSH
jgi:hypothetical protein